MFDSLLPSKDENLLQPFDSENPKDLLTTSHPFPNPLNPGFGEQIKAFDNSVPDLADDPLWESVLDPDETHLDRSLVDLLTGEALQNFAADPDFTDKISLVFGDNWNREVVQELQQDWLLGDFSDIPEVQILSADVLSSANGAYSSETDTIYLSRDFLMENAANPAAVADVLLEEYGHAIDAKINTVDSDGDEGEIFASVVQGEVLSDGELLALKVEDDAGVIMLDGEEIAIEQAKFKPKAGGDRVVDIIRQERGGWMNYSRDAEVLLSQGDFSFNKQSSLPDMSFMNGDFVNLVTGDFNGDGLTDFIRQEKGYWVDGWRDTEVYLASGNGNFNSPIQMTDISAMNGNFVNIVSGDFNGDGKTDIIRQEKGSWAGDGRRDAEIYLSNGNGTFGTPILMNNSWWMNGDFVNLVVGDFTGTGVDSIIRQEKGYWVDGINDVEFLSFSGSNFTKVKDVPDMPMMNGNFVTLVAGDYNGDRIIDLIRQEKGAWSNNYRDAEIYISDGNWNFRSITAMNNAWWMNGDFVNLIAGDVTGDGTDDIIRQEKGYWVDGINDVEFLSFSGSNFTKVKDVPDMSMMNGNFVTLVPGLFGFHVTATPINLNQTLSGTLSTTDPSNPTRSGTYRDDYLLTGVSAGQQVRVNLNSSSFDNYLQVINAATGQVVVENDDANGTNNAEVTFTVQSGVNYLLRTTSWSGNATGSYSISTSVVAPPTVTLTASDASAAEVNSGQTLNPGQFTFTRTGSTASALTVNYFINGTAGNGSDYNSIPYNVTFAAGQSSVTLPINVINDTLVESSETVSLSLATSSAYTVGTSNTATVTIADNDVPPPTVTLTASDASAAEVNSGQILNPGQFTFTRTGSTASSLSVSYFINGTAGNGSDYNSIPFNVTFAAGQSSVTLPINVINDTLVESSETVSLSLATSSAYTVGTSNTATVTIADNDTVATPIEPGNTLGSAEVRSSAIFSRSERVSSGDRDDFYRFNVSQSGVFTANLTGLTGDADVRLIRDANNNGSIDSGEILAWQWERGTGSESIRRFLNAGTYFLQVNSYNNQTANYSVATNFTAAASNDRRFSMQVNFVAGSEYLNSQMKNAVQEAARFWENVITHSSFNGTHTLTIDVGGTEQPWGPMGGALASAGWRSGNNDANGRWMPTTGGSNININPGALSVFSSNINDFKGVMIHEFGHVLGLGTLWEGYPGRNLINRSTATYNANTYAGWAYGEMRGTTQTAIPLTTGIGGGSDFSHWREEIFGNEIMTHAANSGMSTSSMTIAALRDIGWNVNYGAAQNYTLPSSSAMGGLSSSVSRLDHATTASTSSVLLRCSCGLYHHNRNSFNQIGSSNLADVIGFNRTA